MAIVRSRPESGCSYASISSRCCLNRAEISCCSFVFKPSSSAVPTCQDPPYSDRYDREEHLSGDEQASHLPRQRLVRTRQQPRPMWRCRHNDVATTMSPQGCRHKDVATRMSPQGCRHKDVATRMSPQGCRHKDVATMSGPSRRGEGSAERDGATRSPTWRGRRTECPLRAVPNALSWLPSMATRVKGLGAGDRRAGADAGRVSVVG